MSSYVFTSDLELFPSNIQMIADGRISIDPSARNSYIYFASDIVGQNATFNTLVHNTVTTNTVVCNTINVALAINADSTVIDFQNATINFTGASVTGLAGDWLTNGSAIYYNLGNVGIGTSNPTSKLFIDSGNAVVQNTNAAVEVTDNSGTAVTTQMLSTGSYGFVGTKTSDTLYLGTGNSAKVTVLDSGNVGVGVTNPTSKLFIGGGNAVVQNTNAAVEVTDNSGTAVTTQVLSTGSYGFVGTKTSDTLYLGTGNSAKVTVLDSGNVGVGVTNPTNNFEVFSSSGDCTAEVSTDNDSYESVFRIAREAGSFEAYWDLLVPVSSRNFVVRKSRGVPADTLTIAETGNIEVNDGNLTVRNSLNPAVNINDNGSDGELNVNYNAASGTAITWQWGVNAGTGRSLRAYLGGTGEVFSITTPTDTTKGSVQVRQNYSSLKRAGVFRNSSILTAYNVTYDDFQITSDDAVTLRLIEDGTSQDASMTVDAGNFGISSTGSISLVPERPYLQQGWISNPTTMLLESAETTDYVRRLHYRGSRQIDTSYVKLNFSGTLGSSGNAYFYVFFYTDDTDASIITDIDAILATLPNVSTKINLDDADSFHISMVATYNYFVFPIFFFTTDTYNQYYDTTAYNLRKQIQWYTFWWYTTDSILPQTATTDMRSVYFTGGTWQYANAPGQTAGLFGNIYWPNNSRTAAQYTIGGHAKHCMEVTRFQTETNPARTRQWEWNFILTASA